MVTKLPNNIIMIDKCFSVLGCLTDISYLNIKLSEMAIMKNWEPKWVYWWKCILSTGKCKNLKAVNKRYLFEVNAIFAECQKHIIQWVLYGIHYVTPVRMYFIVYYTSKLNQSQIGCSSSFIRYFILKKISLIFPHFL